jgi:hypothetical protein
MLGPGVHTWHSMGYCHLAIRVGRGVGSPPVHPPLCSLCVLLVSGYLRSWTTVTRQPRPRGDAGDSVTGIQTPTHHRSTVSGRAVLFHFICEAFISSYVNYVPSLNKQFLLEHQCLRLLRTRLDFCCIYGGALGGVCARDCGLDSSPHREAAVDSTPGCKHVLVAASAATL